MPPPHVAVTCTCGGGGEGGVEAEQERSRTTGTMQPESASQRIPLMQLSPLLLLGYSLLALLVDRSKAVHANATETVVSAVETYESV